MKREKNDRYKNLASNSGILSLNKIINAFIENRRLNNKIRNIINIKTCKFNMVFYHFLMT